MALTLTNVEVLVLLILQHDVRKCGTTSNQCWSSISDSAA